MSDNEWRVWSYDAASNAWIVVDVGSADDMRAGAERRTASAVKYGMDDSRYVALPSGERPEAAG